MSKAIPEERHGVSPSSAGEVVPGANRPGNAAPARAEPARSPPVRHRSTRSAIIAFVAGIVVATVVFAMLGPPQEGSPYKARKYYQAINLGMTRAEVKRLMRPSYAMYTGIESTDIMIVDERFMIAVTYGPKQPSPAQAGTMFAQPPDDWVVKQKVYVDHQRRGWFENLTTAIGMRPERLTADRVRED